MIPDELVDRIRDEADIVQIIGEHVPLKRLGSDYRGPCPFHQGTHPNFSVSTKKHMYYCFVCHEGGDVFTFLSKRLGMDWPSAVRLVAEKSGIDIPAADAHCRGRIRGSGCGKSPPVLRNISAACCGTRRRQCRPRLPAARAALIAKRLTGSRSGSPPRRSASCGATCRRSASMTLVRLRRDCSQRRRRVASRGRAFAVGSIFPIFDAGGHTVGFGGRLIWVPDRSSTSTLPSRRSSPSDASCMGPTGPSLRSGATSA